MCVLRTLTLIALNQGVFYGRLSLIYHPLKIKNHETQKSHPLTGGFLVLDG